MSQFFNYENKTRGIATRAAMETGIIFSRYLA
jgi:hypothetical protein